MKERFSSKKNSTRKQVKLTNSNNKVTFRRRSLRDEWFLNWIPGERLSFSKLENNGTKIWMWEKPFPDIDALLTIKLSFSIRRKWIRRNWFQKKKKSNLWFFSWFELKTFLLNRTTLNWKFIGLYIHSALIMNLGILIRCNYNGKICLNLWILSFIDPRLILEDSQNMLFKFELIWKKNFCIRVYGLVEWKV